MSDVYHFKNQQYEQILFDVSDKNVNFIDPVFPPNLTSLFGARDPPSAVKDADKIEWKRPQDLCTNPRLIINDPESRTVIQGLLGNCWLVSSIGLISLHSDLITKIIPNLKHQDWQSKSLYRTSSNRFSLNSSDSRTLKQSSSFDSADISASSSSISDQSYHPGVFRFRFYRFGCWTEVVIDDYLPTIEGRLIGAQSSYENEFWIPLLEKAYAKLNNSYMALDLGHAADALVDLTGSIPRQIHVKSVDKLNLYRSMRRNHFSKNLMSCSITASEGQHEKENTEGLVIGHAYSILEIFEFKYQVSLEQEELTVRLLRLRNPWGENKYSGEWNPNSSRLKYLPENVKKFIEKGTKQSGNFWISFDEFYKYFDTVISCKKMNTSFWTIKRRYQSTKIYGSWSASNNTCGGSINHKSFLNNPQYKFTVSDSGADIMISLMQRDLRASSLKLEHITIGFAIMKVEENRQIRAHKIYPIAGSTVYLNSREVSGRFYLGPGHYILLPTTFEPGNESSFLLRVYSDKNISFGLLTQDIPVKKFMRNAPKGVLRLTIQYATNLSTPRIIGKAHPYVKLWMSEYRKSYHTQVSKCGDLNPEFDSNFVFYLSKPSKARLKFQVWDKAKICPDMFMGQTCIDLIDIITPLAEKDCKKRSWTKFLALSNRSKLYPLDVPITGTLQIRLEWSPGLQDC